MSVEHTADEGAAMQRWWREYRDRLRQAARAREDRTEAGPGHCRQTGAERPEVIPLRRRGEQPPWGPLVMRILTGIQKAWGGDGHARAERRESDWYRL